jgi:hypothetical protein
MRNAAGLDHLIVGCGRNGGRCSSAGLLASASRRKSSTRNPERTASVPDKYHVYVANLISGCARFHHDKHIHEIGQYCFPD